MEKLHNPLGRAVSYLLIYLTAIHPLHPAFAAGVNPANGNTQVQAGNVPVINIATPNSAGISHNTYKDFNIGAPGVVLNNSTTAGKSQLAGQVNVNTNLKGNAASLIINEVTSGTRSELNGNLEVFGTKANVMIANPNGITCDGCGFINTPGVTLTTGKPQFDTQGALDALEVKKGSIIIGAKGLDANAQDYVDIISRATELNGKITAHNLSLTQGTNRASYKDGTLTAIAGEGTQPQLAVDTKALGGMYANKIRLVANEDGVGVNLANLTSTQQDITLDTKGKIQLGNIAAKTDLNITAKQTDIIKGATVNSKQDITVASTTLNNNGTLSAGKDMRLFNDSLTNAQATIQANNNLWIQKDALGNKGVKVENLSGTIKTTTGDLVIRTGQLDNVIQNIKVSETNILPTESNVSNNQLGWHQGYTGSLGKVVYHVMAAFSPEEPQKWFNAVDFKTLYELNVERKEYGTEKTQPSVIASGSNLYINATSLNNKASTISAINNMVLTGNDFSNKSIENGVVNKYNLFSENLNLDYLKPVPLSSNDYPSDIHIGRTIRFKHTGETFSWNQKGTLLASIISGGTLTADFKNSISVEQSKPYENTKISESKGREPSFSISAKNVLFNAGTVNIAGGIKSESDITVISEKDITLDNASLSAKNSTALLAANNIDAKQSNIIGKDISLASREGNTTVYSDNAIRHYATGGSRQFGTLSASGDLSIQSGQDIILDGVNVTKNQNASLLAGNNLTIKNNDALLEQQRLGITFNDTEKQKRFNDTFNLLGRINSTDSITLNARNALDIAGVTLNATKDINLTAGTDINLTPRVLSTASKALFANSRQAELSSTINAGNQLLISSGKDVLAQSATLSATGNTTLLAGNSLKLLATAYSAIDSQNDNNADDQNVTAVVHAGNKLTVASNGELIATGTNFSSGGDMVLSSGGKMEFNAAANHAYREGGNAYSESVTPKNAVLNSGGILTLLSNSSILFQATQLIAKGALDTAAQGGFLYAQAVEESNHYEKTTTKRKWYGKKTTIRQISHTVTNKVTEFTAGGDINLLSRDDSTYEASKINAGKNAKLTSTNGKVNFKAVKNTAFEQTISTSKGFFIKNADKGYTKDTWLLPTVDTGGQLTIDAASGVSADVKIQNAQALQNTLLTLGNTPGTTWLKDLNTRKDVQWQAVQDAFSSWNHKSQSLNPVVAAVIAISVAAVTAGSGLAAYGADMAAGTVGSTSAAVTSATYGAAYSGMTALTSQAAVALIDNQGNISKTLQALGSSNSVKSLATAMVIGGALAGFDAVMGFDKAPAGTSATPPGNAKLPLLSHGDWSKIAQRVAGQSIISSSLNTAINGGSFSDNFASALLANVGGQLQAEGAHLIGNNGAVLGAPGKAVSHAVVAGVAAEIGGGNGQGAAAGALAAELAGVILGDNIIKPEEWQKKSEQQAQMARVLGSVAGAVFTGKAEGANSGATGGEAAFRYNYLSHKQKELMDQDLSSAKTPLEKAFVLARWGVTSGKQDGAFAAGVISGVPVEFVETAQSLIALVTNPGEAWDALKALINEDDAWAKVSSSVKQGYINRIDAMKVYYQQAGADGAYYSGLEFGKLATEAAGVVLGAAGVAKGATTLATNTAKALEKAAANTTVSLAEDMALKGITNPKYLNELLNNGIKFTPDEILKIEKLSDGRIIFLEKGNSQSGLQHILERHAEDFLRIGVNEKQIPDLVIKALSEGKIVGYQGKGTGRPIYEVEFNGKNQRVSITVGSNGYIVGANPAGSY